MASSNPPPHPTDETAAAAAATTTADAYLRRDGRRRRGRGGEYFFAPPLTTSSEPPFLTSSSAPPFRSLAADDRRHRAHAHRTAGGAEGATAASTSYSAPSSATATVAAANSAGGCASTTPTSVVSCDGCNDAVSVAVIWLGSAAAGLAAFLLAALAHDRRRARVRARARMARKGSKRRRSIESRSGTRRRRPSSSRMMIGPSGRDCWENNDHGGAAHPPSVVDDFGGVGGGTRDVTRTLSTTEIEDDDRPMPMRSSLLRKKLSVRDLKIDASSQWGEGVAVIESVLEPGSAAEKALTPEQRSGLRSVQKSLLLTTHGARDERGEQGLRAHIPHALLAAGGCSHRTGSGDVGCESSRYLLSHFGGVSRRRSVAETKRKIKQVVYAHAFVEAMYSSLGDLRIEEAYLPAEWDKMSMENKVKVRDMLSWESLKRWDFNVLELSTLSGGHPLLMVGWAILGSPLSHRHMAESCGEAVSLATRLDGYGYADEFSYGMETLCGFLRVMERGYSRENPYHNNIHAADVLQTVHSLLQIGGEEFAQAGIQNFSIMLAAVMHDVGHPGQNNAYQTNAKSDLALRYNDISILENMHASTAFQLIMGENRDANIDILSGMQPDQISSVRKIVIDAILHTDMTKHFAMVDRMKGLLLSKDVETEIKKGEHSLEILNFVLHLADVSNPAKPAPLFLDWTDRCLEEFFAQGDLEKERGLPVSPMCDRDKTSREQSQIGFIQYVVEPAYEVLAKALPAMEDEIMPTIGDNLKYWKSLQAEDKKSEPPAGGE